MELQSYMDESEPYFADRIEAAKLLAKRLEGYRGRNPLVPGIPRGAVPMAEVIAESLGGELNVVLASSCSLSSPLSSIGASAPRGSRAGRCFR
jgi:predicted phosphoribosyltransferase